MKKISITVLPEFYYRYINETDDLDLSVALESYSVSLIIEDKDKLISLGNKVYERDKWTVKDILQHLIDCERIFCYRALRIARNDKTPLPGFDENEYIPEAKTERRTIDELLYELDSVRRTSILLFKSFDDEMLLRAGMCSGKNISVLAIGFTIAGHMLHHINVIKEKYYPLI